MEPITTYLNALKNLILNYTEQNQNEVKIYLIGSRAKGTARRTSDIDIAILPLKKTSESFFSDLRDLIEESTIPYTVDIIDLSKLNEEQKQTFLKKAIVWKD